MRTRRFRWVITPAIALAITLSAWPAPAQPAPEMECAEGFEAVCYAIGAACLALDTVDGKILHKDLINCQLG